MNNIKVAVQIDEPKLLDKNADSTIALIEEALFRRYKVFIYTVDQLSLKDNNPVAICREVLKLDIKQERFLELSREKIKYFDLDCTKNIEKANFAMIADLKDGLSILDFAEYLDKIFKYKLPLLCANPDYLVHNNNTLSMCGGTVAQLYFDLGGTVFRYGKPYEPIYEDIIKRMSIKNKKKVLVIGDSLWHDIAGGRKMKFDTLWIENGVHKPQLTKKDDINQLLNEFTPKYSMSELKL